MISWRGPHGGPDHVHGNTQMTGLYPLNSMEDPNAGIMVDEKGPGDEVQGAATSRGCAEWAHHSLLGLQGNPLALEGVWEQKGEILPVLTIFSPCWEETISSLTSGWGCVINSFQDWQVEAIAAIFVQGRKQPTWFPGCCFTTTVPWWSFSHVGPWMRR